MYNSVHNRLARLEGYAGDDELDVRLLSEDELKRIVRYAGGVGESLRHLSDDELEAIVSGNGGLTFEKGTTNGKF